jgi:hypothetical protein
MNNVIAALEHNNRVSDIKLSDVPSWQLERFVAAMQKPFPELTSLDIGAVSKERYPDLRPDRQTRPPVFPDFVLGSAPCLQSLRLDGIPFLGLPKLLLSSQNLVDFHPWDTPSVYFTPEEIATCLSPMKHLESTETQILRHVFPLAGGSATFVVSYWHTYCPPRSHLVTV